MESIFSDCQDYTTAITAGAGPGPSVATVQGTGGPCAGANAVNQNVRVSAGNTLAIPVQGAAVYTVRAGNPNARPGRTNITIDQTGNINWF
jgi:hypothetical protein